MAAIEKTEGPKFKAPTFPSGYEAQRDPANLAYSVRSYRLKNPCNRTFGAPNLTNSSSAEGVELWSFRPPSATPRTGQYPASENAQRSSENASGKTSRAQHAPRRPYHIPWPNFNFFPARAHALFLHVSLKNKLLLEKCFLFLATNCVNVHMFRKTPSG